MFGAIRFLSVVLAFPLVVDLAHAQTDVAGKTTVPVGQGAFGVNFSGKNKTKREICDFTFKLGAGCGVNMTGVNVQSTQAGGIGDWDVDDNQNGFSQQANEDDDTDSTPGTFARVDSRGTGDEAAPQNMAGKCIKDGEPFSIFIQFSGQTTGMCDLDITPTDDLGFQLCSASLPNGMNLGSNDFLVDNGTIVTSGAGAGVTNNTGATISALHFARHDGLALGTVYQVDPATSAIQAQTSCGGSVCNLSLAVPVPPGGIVSFDATLPQLSVGPTTILSVTPTTGGATIPTMPEWGLIAMAALFLIAGGVWLARR